MSTCLSPPFIISNLTSNELHMIKPVMEKMRAKRPFSSNIKTACSGGLRGSKARLTDVMSTKIASGERSLSSVHPVRPFSNCNPQKKWSTAINTTIYQLSPRQHTATQASTAQVSQCARSVNRHSLRRGLSSKSYKEAILKPVLEKRYVNDSSTERLSGRELQKLPYNLKATTAQVAEHPQASDRLYETTNDLIEKNSFAIGTDRETTFDQKDATMPGTHQAYQSFSSQEFVVCRNRRHPIRSLALSDKRVSSMQSSIWLASSRGSQLPQKKSNTIRLKDVVRKVSAKLEYGSLSKVPSSEKEKQSSSTVSGAATTAIDPNASTKLLKNNKRSDLNLDLNNLIATRDKQADDKVKEHLADVIKMVQLQSVTQEQLCNWSLSRSRIMKQLQKNKMRDDRRLKELMGSRKNFENLSQKQSALFVTPEQLREQEMHDVMRKFILAKDPAKIPIPKRELAPNIVIKFTEHR